ncbi:PH domain-containing protein [Ferruginibacter paludis]|uniref:PH domain-containing protein n=1 Tax=Ferruginibacter paludis TaxID=1310417 RepID=UPI0025B5F3CD|nr:PH domain-containing protein [Ferruginibacter paludis]MDN3655243.1 PH domain-containing protein [Ferruginibacter paludis]
MKRFSSKIGLEIFLPLAVLLLFCIYQAATHSDWIGFFIIVLVILFFVYLVRSTSYVISGEVLQVKCGFFYEKIIDVRKIKTIKEVSDFFGSPATSIKKVEIKYNDKESVAISPTHKADFITTLLHINPAIEIR